MPQDPLYEADFYAWANEQARLLREGKLAQADIEHIAQEIESMGKTEKRELVSRLRVLLLHLLKWRHQPSKRGPSWEASIKVQRLDLQALLKDNPSLKGQLAEVVANAYEGALIEAAAETGLAQSNFSAQCPWTFEQTMAPDFWPDVEPPAH